MSGAGRRRGLGLWKGDTAALTPEAYASGEGDALLEDVHHDAVCRRLQIFHALRLHRRYLPLWGVVAAATCFDLGLGLPIRQPRIFGDELIYWELSRAFAWTGHFTARGGIHLGYGIGYPALVSISHRLVRSEPTAYLIARGLGALMFSLAALPAHAIAVRVLSWRLALIAAGLTVFVPSVVYTSAIMTENAFYPAFLLSVLFMLRALERPTTARQIVVVVAAAAAFLVRAEAIVLLPAYLLASVVVHLTQPGRHRRAAIAAALREQAPMLAAVTIIGIGYVIETAGRGRSTLTALGPYHVLVSTYAPFEAMRWTLANLGDLDLYVGVAPLAAFGVMFVSAVTSTSMVADLRRLVILSAAVGGGVLAATTALSASKWGLGRVHERNLFYLVPLLLIVFIAWINTGFPRPRRAVVVVVPIVVLLPLTIPGSALHGVTEDGIALIWWQVLPVRSGFIVLPMVAFAAVVSVAFVVARRPETLMRICLMVMAATLVAGEALATTGAGTRPAAGAELDWIDKAVGSRARVAAIWVPRRTAAARSIQVRKLWLDEFFNRSVGDVASLGGPLPDGLPVEQLALQANGCLTSATVVNYAFAVVGTGFSLDAPVIARSASTGSTLYRLERHPGAVCVEHVQDAQHVGPLRNSGVPMSHQPRRITRRTLSRHLIHVSNLIVRTRSEP